MTNFRIESRGFSSGEVDSLKKSDPTLNNWPVVYTLNGKSAVYVGETNSAAQRIKQHRQAKLFSSSHINEVRIVLSDTFNKSVCLDLESYLIRLFAGDGTYQVLNKNEGQVDHDYYDRASYQATFADIFAQLKSQGLFNKSIEEIQNSALYKLSPFKSLTQEQAVVIEGIVEDLFDRWDDPNSGGTFVIEGGAGTGKTILGIYLIKLLLDIKASFADFEVPPDGLLADFYTAGHRELLADARIGIVVPQQSLRRSIESVFAKTPLLKANMVLSPFTAARSPQFDLLVVDEAHRLNSGVRFSSGPLYKQVKETNEALFGDQRGIHSQFEWLQKVSRYQILLLDPQQTIRTADLTPQSVKALTSRSRKQHRYYQLTSQMRVAAGDDYIQFTKEMFDRGCALPEGLNDYELFLFADPGQMDQVIRERDQACGLSRMVAGFAWPWNSKTDSAATDIVIGNFRRQWNRATKDWINSATALDEVGSIHTVQGYDLNYAGVIIGPDIQFDPVKGVSVFSRDNYYDKLGMSSIRELNLDASPERMLMYVKNIYSVLLTRGMRGTFIYACDPALHEHLKTVIPSWAPAPSIEPTGAHHKVETSFG